MITFSRECDKLLKELRKFSPDTYDHCLRVKKLTYSMINYINHNVKQTFSQDKIDSICKGAMLHDIGKLFVRNYLLTKRSKLTPDEYAALSQHTTFGSEALQDGLSAEESQIIQDICIYHHERIAVHNAEDDAANTLPLYVQIVSVCDSYDALCSKRYYHEAYSPEKSLEMIVNGECGCFSKLILDCLQAIDKDSII